MTRIQEEEDCRQIVCTPHCCARDVHRTHCREIVCTPHCCPNDVHGTHCTEIVCTPHCCARDVHGTHCRQVACTPHCCAWAAEFPRSVYFLYDVRFRSYRALNFISFHIFAYFWHTKCIKIPFRMRPTAQGLHCRILTVILHSTGRSKGCLLLRSTGRSNGCFYLVLAGQRGVST